MADINKIYPEIIKAINDGDLDRLKELLAIDEKLSANYANMFALEAGRVGKLNIVKFLLQTYPNRNSYSSDTLANNVLRGAVERNHIAIVRYMLASNQGLAVADNGFSNQKLTARGMGDALYFAVERNFSRILDTLLQYAQLPDLTTALIIAVGNKKGKMILSLAAIADSKNIVPTVNYFLRNISPSLEGIIPALLQEQMIEKVLLEYDAKKRALEDQYQAEYESSEYPEGFDFRHYDPVYKNEKYALDSEYESYLRYAQEYNLEDSMFNSIKFLAKYTGAFPDLSDEDLLSMDLSTRDLSNEDLLVWAAAIGSLDLVKILIGMGVDPNYKDRLALQSAQTYGRLDVVSYLNNL